MDIDYQGLEWARSGPRESALDALKPINAFDATWFAWAAFYPDAEVLAGGQ